MFNRHVESSEHLNLRCRCYAEETKTAEEAAAAEDEALQDSTVEENSDSAD